MVNKASTRWEYNPGKWIRRIRNALRYFYRSLHLSMRKKISFDFLIIYIMISIVVISFVPLSYVFYEISMDAQSIGNDFTQIFTAYSKKLYTDEDLALKIDRISTLNNNSYQVYRFHSMDTVSDQLLLETGAFADFDYPSNIIERFSLILKQGLIPKKLTPITIYDEQLSAQIFYVRSFYPISNYRHSMFILAILILIFMTFGFIFMAMLGGIRVKQVLNPIFYMTKAAGEISMNNINKRLDVESTKYELKDLAITLNEMLDRLDRDYGKQKRFVSDVSHELRTPISVINGYASMLERWGKEDEEILEESIGAISAEAKNMQVLVENLLTLVRFDNQTLKYEYQQFDIGKLCCDVVKEFNMVNMKMQDISCEAEENIRVHLDQGKIKQILRIFVDNAVKYTPNGGTIFIRCKRHEDRVQILIKDSGIGISMEDLPHLFERFYRSDESRTRQTGGHGLGLAIAKVLVLGQQGRIKVKSRLGNGSEFLVSLPFSIQGEEE
ncbi:MAG: HAMP domain-containing protein [Vallitaleaceae bacterium]|nr:HAMP domain-containing protein [Vallitaleaceae bacterium]